MIDRGIVFQSVECFTVVDLLAAVATDQELECRKISARNMLSQVMRCFREMEKHREFWFPSSRSLL